MYLPEIPGQSDKQAENNNHILQRAIFGSSACQGIEILEMYSYPTLPHKSPRTNSTLKPCK